MTTPSLTEAAERLRRVKAGEDDRTVYGLHKPPDGWLVECDEDQRERIWLVSWRDVLRKRLAKDRKEVADAMLPLLDATPVTLDAAKALGFLEWTDSCCEHPCGLRWLLPVKEGDAEVFPEAWKFQSRVIPTPNMGQLRMLLLALGVTVQQEETQT